MLFMGFTEKKKTSIGLKLLIGMAISSNLLLAGIFFIHWQANERETAAVNELLFIKERLSTDLRATIVSLQKKFLSLPDFLMDRGEADLILELKGRYARHEDERLEGRTAFSSMYSRKERRDLAKGIPVVSTEQDRVVVAVGVFDEAGLFTSTIDRLLIPSATPAVEAEKIQALIKRPRSEDEARASLDDRMDEFINLIANEALEAEKHRLMLIDWVETIKDKEDELSTIRRDKLRTTLMLAILTFVINMTVLFLLTRIIVSRPLSRLTRVVDDISGGGFPEIPYLHRRDEIGVLSVTLRNFQEVRRELEEEERRGEEAMRAEERRGVHEKRLIDDVLDSFKMVIHRMTAKANEQVALARAQHGLAEKTAGQAAKVARGAENTSRHINSVSESTLLMKESMGEVTAEVGRQEEVILRIIADINASRARVDQLDHASTEVRGIVDTVRTITSQTKLLALNASIEAAHAGEMGRGFQVVAQEVKMLSQQTEAATGEIITKISAIEEAGAEVIAHLRQTERRMIDLTEASTRITASVDEQERASAVISAMTRKASSDTEQVAGSIAMVHEAAGKALLTSTSVSEHAEDIAEALNELLVVTTEKLRLLGRVRERRILEVLEDQGEGREIPISMIEDENIENQAVTM